MAAKVSVALGCLGVVALGCSGEAPRPADAPPVASEIDACDAAAARIIGGLRDPVSVTAYLTHGGPKLDAAARQVDEFFGRLARVAPGKLVYRSVDPNSERLAREAKDAGLQEAVFGEMLEGQKDAAQIVRGYFGVAFQTGSEKGALAKLDPGVLGGLEFWTLNKIIELRNGAEGRHLAIGVVTGKDEIKISDANLVPSQPGRGAGPNLKSIIEKAFPYYRFEDVDLANGGAAIDKALVGLLVTQPGKDFTEKELRRIDQFLMLGNKGLAVFAGAVNLKASDAGMKGELDLHGLDKLVEGYGVEMKKDAIFDWGRPLVIHIRTQGKAIQVTDFGMVQAEYDAKLDDEEQTLDPSFAAFFRLEELAVPFPSTLVPHPEKQPNCSVKAVIRTTRKSTAVTADSVDEKAPMLPGAAPHGEYAQRVVAVAVGDKEDGGAKSPCKLKSAYEGREGQGVSASAESAQPSRVLVVASPQFFDNPFARQGSAPPPTQTRGATGGDEDLQIISQSYAQQYLTATIVAFKETLDWMANEDGVGACPTSAAAKR